MTLINHATYQPTPRDMMIALKTISDIVKENTGKTPDIMVGSHKLSPPKNGNLMSKKDAVATHEALYGEKGTISVRVDKTPVFKQTSGKISKDNHQLESSLKSRLAPLSPKEDITIEPIIKDRSSTDLAVDQNPLKEEDMQELAKSQKDNVYESNTSEILDIEFPLPEPLQEEAVVSEDRFNDEPSVAQETVLDNQNSIEHLESESIEIKKNYGDSFNGQDSQVEPISIEKDNRSWWDKVREEPDNYDDIQLKMAEDMDERNLTIFEAEYKANHPEETEYEVGKTELVNDDDLKLAEISKNLVPDQRFAPGTPQNSTAIAAAQAEIAQLTEAISAMQVELASMRQTVEKIANKDPLPKIRQWAKNQATKVIDGLQNRAKVDLVRTVNFGKDLAQKAMDEIGKTAGLLETGLLNLDSVSRDLKTVMFEIHDGVPKVEIKQMGYTFLNNEGNISVHHKDRGEVFSVTEKGANFKGRIDDYKMLSNVKAAVATLAGPAAVIAELTQAAAIDAVKQEGQKAAVKL